MRRKENIDFSDIPELTAEDLKRGRRATPAEIRAARKAYENTFGEKPPRRGRPRKPHHHKYRDVHIKLHPQALRWARAEAKRRGVGYQTVINEALLRRAA